MPTWPSPSSERLGTPKIPAIRFTRGTYFGASRFTYATACQVARPPLTDRTRSPRPQRAFTSRLPAVWSPSLPLDITTTWTGLPLLAGLAPARMAASLAAPDPRRAGERGLGAAGRPLDHGEGWRRGPQWRRFGGKRARALCVVAENVAGVKAVEDHLVWIEPVSGIVIDPRQDERGSS